MAQHAPEQRVRLDEATRQCVEMQSARIAAKVPMRRMGRPDEIANDPARAALARRGR